LAAGPAGEHDDGDLGPAAQPLDDLDAVDVREAEVEDDQVRPQVRGLAQRGDAVSGYVEVVVAGAQVDAHGPQDLGFVVDDQDAGHDCGPAAGGGAQGVNAAGDRWVGGLVIGHCASFGCGWCGGGQGKDPGQAAAGCVVGDRVPSMASVSPRVRASPRPTPAAAAATAQSLSP
jgi:hypothetical protein